MLHCLKEFYLKRISNRIGGGPDQLLMKCVRVGSPAIFKGLHTKYKVQFTGQGDSFTSVLLALLTKLPYDRHQARKVLMVTFTKIVALELPL